MGLREKQLALLLSDGLCLSVAPGKSASVPKTLLLQLLQSCFSALQGMLPPPLRTPRLKPAPRPVEAAEELYAHLCSGRIEVPLHWDPVLVAWGPLAVENWGFFDHANPVTGLCLWRMSFLSLL